jgi:hypothetical protein
MRELGENKPKVSPIDKLPIQDYSQNPRTEYRFVGQNAAIRQIDHMDRLDMQRVRALQEQQQSDYFMQEDLSERQLLNWIKDKSPRQQYLIFGVAGYKSTSYTETGEKTTTPLPETEQGELQGWIYIDRFPSREVKKMVKAGIIPEPIPGQDVLQIQHGKFPGTPDKPTPNGQMASALRQMYGLIGHIDYFFHKDRIEKQARIRAHIHPDTSLDNLTAEELVAFKTQEDVLWQEQGTKPTQIVAGTISPRNKESMRVAEATGRVRAEKTLGHGTIEGDEDYYYILDWDKFSQIMQEQALNENPLQFPPDAKVVTLEKKETPS